MTFNFFIGKFHFLFSIFNEWGFALFLKTAGALHPILSLNIVPITITISITYYPPLDSEWEPILDEYFEESEDPEEK